MRKGNLFFILLVFMVLSGCESLGPRSEKSLGLNEVLEPVKDSLVVKEKMPLEFPSPVAILMVPGSGSGLVPGTALRMAAEELKKSLLKNEKYVSTVSIVGADDIQQKISLKNIHDLYGANVVVIVSYQQEQRREQPSVATFFDLAIVPAFAIPSVKVTTTTIVEGKIIHIPSDAIVFRSGAIDERSRHMTRVTSDQSKSNEESIEGLKTAVNKFGASINGQLARLDEYDFRNATTLSTLMGEYNLNSKRDASSPDNWAKVDALKKSGGSFGGAEIVLALVCLGYSRKRPGFARLRCRGNA